MRRAFRISGYCAFVLVATTALLEVSLRVLQPYSRGLRTLLYQRRHAGAYDSADNVRALLEQTTVGYSPGSEFCGFCLNSRGFLTPEYSRVKPADTFRIVALGDSFTFKAGAVPFDSQWTTQLGKRLKDLWPCQVDVINLGMPAVGPKFEFRVWQLEARQLDPDAVVLAFFVGNDFVDEMDAPGKGMAPVDSGVHSWLLQSSLTYRSIRNFSRLVRAQHGSDVKRQSDAAESRRGSNERRMGLENPEYPLTYDDAKPNFTEADYFRIEAERMHLTLRSRRRAFDAALAYAAETLDSLAAEVAEAGSRLVVMIIPDEFQVDDDLRIRVMASVGTREEEYDLDIPQRELMSHLTRKGIDALDLLPVFREEGRHRRLYRPNNSHWNVAGNALAAERLTQHLAKLR